MAVDTSVFARIIKQEKQEDGTLLVTGIATDDTLDVDEQICDPAWLERAMPAWFKYGNIREQHSNIAAGVATKYEMDGSQHIITARVVDPSSVKKVETGVLKGFSIGIRNPRISTDKDARGGRIVDGEIVEVSIVDRPANPSCLLELAKASGGELRQVENLIEKDGSPMEHCAKCNKEYKVEDLHDKMCKECGGAEKAAKPVTEESSTPAASETSVAPEESSEGSDTESSLEEEKSPEAKTVEAIPARTGEESSQVPGEESSQKPGEESSRLGGVAGEAGKSDKTDKRLKKIEKSLARLEAMLQESTSADKATKAVSAESVEKLSERVAKVEKSASRGPARTAVKAAPQVNEVNEKAAKAADYRAKAAATTDQALASAYLLAAAEAESTI